MLAAQMRSEVRNTVSAMYAGRRKLPIAGVLRDLMLDALTAPTAS